MHDLSEPSWQPLMAVQDRLRAFFSLHCYKVLDTPILEPTELFLRKSGGEIAARMYTFVDPGGNHVSLRPEFTSSVLRSYIESEASSPLPARIQYVGPVFRYDGDEDSYRQYTQAGVELLGSDSPRADAEILTLSFASLTDLGISNNTLELSDVGILHRLLHDLGLSERSVLFILGSIGELKLGEDGLERVRSRAKTLRIGDLEGDDGELAGKIREMADEEARNLLYGMIQWSEVGSLGQREPDGVVERLLTKFKGTDDPRKLEKGMGLVSSLAGVRGGPESSLNAARHIIRSNGLDPTALDRLEETLTLVDGSVIPKASLVLDFGLARDIAYYTGLIFEVRHASVPFSLAGGGRCDTLAKALGSSVDIPVLGFAYTVELLQHVLKEIGSSMTGEASRSSGVLVLPSDGAYQQALKQADELRSQGCPVEMDVCAMSLEAAISYARDSGIGQVVQVAADGSNIRHPVPTGVGPGAQAG